MSVDATKLLFEGFLQKRKDSMKMWWVTYWFRLQNTTLFFYTEKNGGASHLRGYYYIHTVQSVREVHRANMSRFIFEIVMTNGKRKVLAAETAALRKEWVGHLWRAMRLSASWVSDSRGTHLDEDEQRDVFYPSTPEPSDEHQDKLPNSSDTDSGGELLLTRRFSAPAPSQCIDQEAQTDSSPVCRPDEPDSVVDIDPPIVCNQENRKDRCHDDTQEGLYDVLPLRNKICVLENFPEAEVIYDSPVSYRSLPTCQDMTDSIYDVPSTLLRKIHTIDEQLEEEECFWGL